MDENLKKGTELLDRYNRLPGWPLAYSVLFILGLSFFFAFYDMVVIGFALPEIIKKFQVSQAFADWSITSGLVGYVIGAILDARISDKCGRRIAVMLSIAFYAIGALLTAASTSMGWLIFWRLICGLGLGAEIACCVSYVSELAPSTYRGKAVAIAVAFGFIGFALTPYISLAILPFFTWGWRLLFIIGGVCGLVAFFLRRHMPQSPCWLVAKGRLVEAEAVVRTAEELVKARNLNTLPMPVVAVSVMKSAAVHTQDSLKQLFFSRHLIYLCLFILIWFFYYVGNYGFLTLQDSLLIKVGFSMSHSLFIISLQSIGFVLGAVIAIYMIDRVERKILCAIIAFIWAISLFIIGWFTVKAIIVLFGFICAITIATLVPMMYTYTAENFPTRFRATSTAITDGIGHLGAAFCAQIIFFFYNLYSTPLVSFTAAMWTMAVTGIVTGILLLFGKKRTNQCLDN